ncbi:hypothetical protein J2X26_001696 [Cellulomonas humilata]|uniref:Uncharacterized protein n=1 Tax=Cellulomonas humilata TaxID=144055 RepID=A0ABU0EDN3_9CELL|nr:hypothetical protein [Cellulomonas humilata]
MIAPELFTAQALAAREPSPTASQATRVTLARTSWGPNARDAHPGTGLDRPAEIEPQAT